MGIANGNESKKWSSDFMSGVAPCRVLAVNPTREELEELFGIRQDKEPRYVGKNKNGTHYGAVRFYLETVSNQLTEHQLRVMLSICIQGNNYAEPELIGTYCAIDPYGRLSWIPRDTQRGSDLRICRIGEDNLTTFLRSFLDIPYPVGEVNNSERETYLCRLDTVKEIIKGDATEVREAVMRHPDNLVNCLIGVRTNPDGMHKHCVFPRMFTASRIVSQKAFTDALNRARKNSPYLRRDYYELGVLHHIDMGLVYEHDALDHDAQPYYKESPIYNDEIMISNDVW